MSEIKDSDFITQLVARKVLFKFQYKGGSEVYHKDIKHEALLMFYSKDEAESVDRNFENQQEYRFFHLTD